MALCESVLWIASARCGECDVDLDAAELDPFVARFYGGYPVLSFESFARYPVPCMECGSRLLFSQASESEVDDERRAKAERAHDSGACRDCRARMATR